MINNEGVIVDSKIISILDVLRETYNIPSNEARIVDEFCQCAVSKPALYYDNLRDSGFATNLINVDQAKRILEIVDSDYKPTGIPRGWMKNIAVMIVTFELNKPLIDIRFDDIEKCFNTSQEYKKNLFLSSRKYISRNVRLYKIKC